MAPPTFELIAKEKEDIAATLPSWLDRDRWFALAFQVARNPGLARCSRESLLDSVRQIAAWGLELDGEEATIIPYGQVATPTAMVKGVIHRVIDSGAAVHLYSEIICEGERVRVLSGTTGRSIEHELAFGTRGKIIGAYAVAILPGGITDFELFGSNDIEAVQRAALRISGGKPSPAWSAFPGEMIKKSVLRRLCKRLRGRRDTEAGQRCETMMESMTRVDPDPTPPLTADDMPKAATAPEGQAKGGATESSHHGTAGSSPPTNPGRTPTLIDAEQLTTIDENAQSTAIPPKRYMQLMKEFAISDEHQLMAEQLPRFLERMHELAHQQPSS